MSTKKLLLVTLVAFALASIIFISKNDETTAEMTAPTTATLKPVADGPDYLRLEQVHPEVIARFLLTCYDSRMYWNAGIVTTPELSTLKLKQATKNYLEIDSEEILIAQGDTGAKAVDSTLWILRPLDTDQVTALKKAHTLGAWTENGGDFRWGAFMHIGNVHSEISSYIAQCK